MYKFKDEREKNKQSVSIQEKIEGGENTEEYGYNDFDKNASQIPYEESSIKMQKVSNDNLFVSVNEKTSLENNEYNKQKSVSFRHSFLYFSTTFFFSCCLTWFEIKVWKEGIHYSTIERRAQP